MSRQTLFIGCLAVLLTGFAQLGLASDDAPGASGAAQVAQGTAGGRIGGTCSYREVPGSATIMRVARTAASSQQAKTAGGPGYEGLEVGFTFKPNQPIADAAVRKFAMSTHLLRLTNSWYPGPRYIEKYHLSQNHTMPAVLKVRTSGACTPMLFAFPGIDLADYFERAR